MYDYKFNPACLKNLRDLHSYTQADAADRADVSQQQWARWETGESSPSADSLCKIFFALHVYFGDIPSFFLSRET